jgi:hypothetical protein
MCSQEQKDIKAVYEEICRSHDGIVDFRSKLLAFLPIASGVGVLVLVNEIPVDVQPSPLFLPAGVFGAVTTLGLFIYELRGIQTCHALLESARKLERELLGKVSGFGPFTLKPPDLWGVIGTAGAALLIYPTVIGAWVFIAGIGLLNSLDESGINSVLKVAAGFTLGLTLLGLVVHLRQEESLQAEVKTRERKAEEQALAANAQSGAS